MVVLFLSGCSWEGPLTEFLTPAVEAEDGGEDGAIDETSESGEETGVDAGELPVGAESGFIELEESSYEMGDGQVFSSFKSSSTRLWYTFLPSDSDVFTSQLFVMFNGGPGFATTAGLLPFGTAPRSIRYENGEWTGRTSKRLLSILLRGREWLDPGGSL